MWYAQYRYLGFYKSKMFLVAIFVSDWLYLNLWYARQINILIKYKWLTLFEICICITRPQCVFNRCSEFNNFVQVNYFFSCCSGLMYLVLINIRVASSILNHLTNFLVISVTRFHTSKKQSLKLICRFAEYIRVVPLNNSVKLSLWNVL